MQPITLEGEIGKLLEEARKERNMLRKELDQVCFCMFLERVRKENGG